jgi:hypothetical protein
VVATARRVATPSEDWIQHWKELTKGLGGTLISILACC